jgi:hypothetical protein
MRLLSILFLLFGATGASHEHISEIAIRDNESEDENSIWSAKGVTHADLREEAASDLNLPEDYEENADRFEDGFLTSTGRFVDREEAARIATEAGQAKQPLHEDREAPSLQHSDLLPDSLGSLSTETLAGGQLALFDNDAPAKHAHGTGKGTLLPQPQEEGRGQLGSAKAPAPASNAAGRSSASSRSPTSVRATLRVV